jgi:hypothetical protein
MYVAHEGVECLAFSFRQGPSDSPDRVTDLEIFPVDVFATPQGNFFVFGWEIGVQHRIVPLFYSAN